MLRFRIRHFVPVSEKYTQHSYVVEQICVFLSLSSNVLNPGQSDNIYLVE